MMQDLLIECFPLGPLPTNAYMVSKPSSQEAIVIDVPPESVGLLLDYLNKKELSLKAIFITHGHWDHFADAKALKDKTEAPVYAHEGDTMLLESPLLMKPFMPWGLQIQPLGVDLWLKGGECLKFLDTTCIVRHVPGHAPGNVLFYFPDHACAFVGDAIFKGSIGRTDLWGGNHKTLLHSIRTQIFTLPASTTLYSGHGPETSVAQEKASNPYCKG